MNWQTAVVLLIVVAAFVAVIVSSVRNRKKGKCSCGGSCGTCGMNCHQKNDKFVSSGMLPLADMPVESHHLQSLPVFRSLDVLVYKSVLQDSSKSGHADHNDCHLLDKAPLPDPDHRLP